MSKIKVQQGQTDGKLISLSEARKQDLKEIGTPGLELFGGYVRQAYISELQWPTVYTTYNRIRRSDPEITMVRRAFEAIGRAATFYFEEPEGADATQQQAAEFGNQVLDDIENNVGDFRDGILSYVPFLGWGWWEIVPGIRLREWKPPDPEDPWRSEFNDGYIGIRRLAFRDHSSFWRWDINERTGRLKGFEQLDPPNPPVTIPLDRSIHLRFGDISNPEGLSPLEAIWRLERYLYGLEVVQGIGFEHAAGYLDIKVEGKLDETSEAKIKQSARNIMTAQEGNYAVWPEGVTGEIKDIDFSAAGDLRATIQFYATRKLQIFMAQWIALSATTGTGSFAAKVSDTGMFIEAFNSMMEGFAEQIDAQLGRWLFRMNADHFPGMEERPRIKATRIEKEIELGSLGQFLSDFVTAGLNLDDDDELAIRRKSQFLPEKVAEPDEAPEPPPTDDEGEAEDMLEDSEVMSALASFSQWARKSSPRIFQLLSKRIE